jgi:hypothetical protein
VPPPPRKARARTTRPAAAAETAADRKARLELQDILDDGHTDTSTFSDAETVLTVWDCSQCVQPDCWNGTPVGSTTEPPLCIPSTMTMGNEPPGPVLPPPL